MKIDCNVNTDENVLQEKINSKSSFNFFLSNLRNMEINYNKNSSEINLLNDFTDVLLNYCKRAFSFKENQDLKNLCVNSPNSFIDLQNEICLQGEFCKAENFNDNLFERYLDRINSIKTLINQNNTKKIVIKDMNFYSDLEGIKCANCIDEGAFYDRDKGNCFFGLFPLENVLNDIQIFSFTIFGIRKFSALVFLSLYFYSYFKEKKTDNPDELRIIYEDKENYRQWIGSSISITDFCLDVLFFIGAVYAEKSHFITYFILITFLPLIYFILGTVLYIKNAYSFIKRKWFKIDDNKFSYVSCCLTIGFYPLFIFVFPILSCLNLIGNHINLLNINNILSLILTDDYYSNNEQSRINKRNLKYYMKLAEFIAEIIFEIILNSIVIFSGKRRNAFEIISITISILSFFASILIYLIGFIENSRVVNDNNININNKNNNNINKIITNQGCPEIA